MLKNRIHLGERAAHRTVTAHSTAELYNAEGVDWPVSGDETLLAYGYSGRATATPSVWSRPGVRPKPKTAGILAGSIIRTNDGSHLRVTRVGSIAGRGIAANGREVRWEAWEVDEVILGDALDAADAYLPREVTER